MRDRSNPRNIWWLVVAICGICVLAWFVNTYPPHSWQLFIVFFSLIFLTSLFLLLYLLNNVRRSLLLSTGLIVYLILQLLNLRELYYPILLLATLLSLELMLRKR